MYLIQKWQAHLAYLHLNTVKLLKLKNFGGRRIPGKMSVLFKLYYTNKYTIYRCKYFRKMCEQNISNVHRIYHIGDGCFIFIKFDFLFDKKIIKKGISVK